MKNLPFHTLDLLRWGSVSAVVLAVILGTSSLVHNERGLLVRYWARYCTSLERKMRGMFIFAPGRRIAVAQVAVIVSIMAAALSLEFPGWYLAIFIAAMAPSLYLEAERRKRVLQIEDQLDGCMLALANALKSTPSIGAAFSGIAGVTDEPLKSEIELALKEMKVGSTLDQALLHMASRVGSRQLDSSLSSILIGRQVGGNLPKVLEQMATTLREMKRLEGVIRTKTADGRMQLWVIGAMPLVFLLGFGLLWPGYFDPLTASLTGYAIVGFVATAWVSALVLARQVLAVDL